VAAGETDLEMCVRHVAEQKTRIARQQVLIERLGKFGLSTDASLIRLGEMRELLATMLAHVRRLSN
jgi:hypothetical protein